MKKKKKHLKPHETITAPAAPKKEFHTSTLLHAFISVIRDSGETKERKTEGKMLI